MGDAFSIVQYPDEPIVVTTLSSSFTVASNLAPLMEQARHIFDCVDSVFNIVDGRGVKATFEDLVAASNESARGANTILHHPSIREIVVVTDDRLVALAVKGLQSPVFGLRAVSVFETLDDALAYCREKISITGP
jgi:hypothetical protein